MTNPVTPWCRAASCGEPLDPSMVDRADGSGLHSLCTEVVAPAVMAGPAQAVALLTDKLGAVEVVNECDAEPDGSGIMHLTVTEGGNWPHGRVIQVLADAERAASPAPYCAQCDTDTHRCPGCGADVPHGTIACAACSAQPAGPCKDAWCKGKCGFNVAAHIKAHGPSIVISGKMPADYWAPAAVQITNQGGTNVTTDDGAVRRAGLRGAEPGGAGAGLPGPLDSDQGGAGGAPARVQDGRDGVPLDGVPEQLGGSSAGREVAPITSDTMTAFSAWLAAQSARTCIYCNDAGNCQICETTPAPAPAPPAPTFAAPAGTDPWKQEIIHVVRWYDGSRPRSRQRKIGPSEIGVPCLRRLGYSAAQTEPANAVKDPWFAIIGTSVHAWLHDAFAAYNESPDYTGPKFQLEQRLSMSSDKYGLSGSCDVYRNGKVDDWKVVGPDALKKARDNGPSSQYRVQVQTYGLGWEQAGWPVDRVGIVFLPRSGYLDSMHVWSEPYDRQVALDALERLAGARDMTALLGAGALPAAADRGCVFCPFFRPGAAADATGCPGK